MTHPLIARLTTDLGWPLLSTLPDVETFTTGPGVHCLFIPGDPAKNLETTDAAVILPELVQAFQGRFDCALVDECIDKDVREAAEIFKTPLLIFYKNGQLIGTIPRVRDWSEYLSRITQILEREPEGVS